jgi:hypothetical protein
MRTFLNLFLLLFVTQSQAQGLHGTIIDNTTKNPIAYATVKLHDAAGKLITGTLTDEKGKFLIKVTDGGPFTLNCNALGYKLFSINLKVVNSETDLGVLLLIPESQQLNEVTIAGQQPTVRIQQDKKIYEIGKDVLSQNGSISDALNGIPAVAVDPQGGVTLRGNAGVTILINGRRSGLTQGSSLDQLQADQVERIEVITSPSARYDASGSAGVINIILKKNKKAGFNGQLKVVAGSPNDTRVNPSINYKSEKINIFSTLGMRKSDYKGLYATDQVTDANAMQSKQTENRHDDGKMLYFGADLVVNPKGTMTAAYLWNGTHDHDKTQLNYDYRSTKPDSTLIRNGESWEKRNYHQLEYNFTQLFTKAKQKWTVDLQYNWWDSQKDWDLATQKLYPALVNYPNLRTRTQDANHDLLVQSDFVQPIAKETILELGVKLENRQVNYNSLAEQQTTNGYVTYRGLDMGLKYTERIQGGYAQMATKLGKLSLLGGVRLEMTRIASIDRDGSYDHRRNYAQLFPTLHLDYSLSNLNTLQAHYSRRILRPSLYQLSPFTELTDLNAQSTGNPELNPALADLYELGFLYRTSQFTINPSLYAQEIQVPLVDYNERNAAGTFITLPVNIDQEHRQGVELNVTYSPLNSLQLNADFNWFRFQQSGTYKNLDFGFSSHSSTARFSTQYKLAKTLGLQARYYFNGASGTSQSRTKALHWADFGISKNLFADKLGIVADVTNAFDTRRYRTTTTGQGYVLTTMNRFNGARYRLSLVYKFKQGATAREAKARNRG